MPRRSPSRLIERLAERERAILDRVVIVDLEVAPAFEDQIEAGVPGERAEHVVEEADAGRDLRPAAAIERRGRPRSPSPGSCG